ncbi:MAG: hypothetical protein JSR19_09290 [Proteobacteria bacterium]|nr:hypothetical protein [Pseudomonadota bacterium]HQR05152.1 BPSS1780 family membrane protein [Rhodocyclaceae bacterium]
MNPASPNEIRTLPAERGTAWLSEGWALFRAEPGLWIGMTVLFLLIQILLGMVPFLGSFATALLTPVLIGGLMAGCAAQSSGTPLRFDTLFAGFRQRTGDLLMLGLLQLAAVGAILVLAAVVVFATGSGAILSHGALMREGMGMLFALAGVLFAGLVVLLLFIPLTMAMWFAAPLVILGGRTPVAAFRQSFDACLVNWLPFLIYGLVVFVLVLIAAIPFGLGFLVLLPVLLTSTYAAYRDIFSA